jgi:hypothetical protein
VVSTATVNSNLNAAMNAGGGGVLAFAYDADVGSLWLLKDGNINTGSTANVTNLSNASGELAYMIREGSGSVSGTNNLNFGQRPFTYTPPAGYQTLCTTNLPNPTILQGNQYFDASLYTGNGTSQTITNSGSMQPDFVWVKVRSTSGNPVLVDSVRGANKTIYSPQTTAEETPTAGTGILSFNSNGFSLGGDISGTSFGSTNGNTFTYVGWQWRASNATAITNTAGSITSSVSANPSAGFSVVTYTGTGSNATVGHGIGVAPRMVIVKRRNSTSNWPVFHSNAGNEAVGFLNSTSAFSSPETTYWNATSPTSTVFSVGTNAAVNASGGTYVAYVFAPVEGYCSIGRYTGNGSADGTFAYTGFRPRYIMIKNRDAAGFDWILMDTSRDPSNVATQELYADLSIAEGTAANNLDILSNGFKIRRNNAAVNTDGGAYMYIAFAENPFKNALAR